MKISQIQKLYLSNFLTGLVFWYGIEKLFMLSIGIDALGMSIAVAVLLLFILVFDIPSGILADKWSRKGVLIVSIIALSISSVILGVSNNLSVYIIGYLIYGIYVVSTSGTYAAITYDILHEEGRSKQYSKIIGRQYALFLLGTAIANLASGFISNNFSFQTTFFITVFVGFINILVILNIKEPKFQKKKKKEKILNQLSQTLRIIKKNFFLWSLVIITSALAIVELFKSEFGQLYFLSYLSEPQIIGILWAFYSISWAIGSLIAHKLRNNLNILIILTTVPMIGMAFIGSWFGITLFMLQGIAAGALQNQIETRLQENTPSNVRASVLSIISTVGRAIAIPFSIILGLIIKNGNILIATQFIGFISLMILIYWIWANHKIKKYETR